MLQSKQMGRRENKHVNFEGRVPFDLLLVRGLFRILDIKEQNLYLSSIYIKPLRKRIAEAINVSS